MFTLGAPCEKKKNMKNALSFSSRLCDRGYHSNTQANTVVSIYNTVNKTHIVLIRKIVKIELQMWPDYLLQSL